MQRVIVYGCGGAGITITAKEVLVLENDSRVNVVTKYIDTSRADIDSFDLDPSRVHVVTNSKVDKRIDGSGGIREALDKHISASMETYMEQLDYEKEDIHIVVSSASGGSGSLIAPRLIHNLKSAGLPVIYITLVDTSSVQYCETSIKTLKHIDLMGRKYDYTVPTLVVDNNESIKVVNNRIGINATLLSILLTSTHKSLDTADMSLFASNAYDKTTKGLVTLSVHTEERISTLKGSFISTLRVLTNDQYYKIDTTILDKVRQYKIGYTSTDTLQHLSELSLDVPIFFAITPNSAVSKIEAIKEELEDKLTIKEDKQEVFSMDEDIGGVSI